MDQLDVTFGETTGIFTLLLRFLSHERNIKFWWVHPRVIERIEINDRLDFFPLPEVESSAFMPRIFSNLSSRYFSFRGRGAFKNHVPARFDQLKYDQIPRSRNRFGIRHLHEIVTPDVYSSKKGNVSGQDRIPFLFRRPHRSSVIPSLLCG